MGFAKDLGLARTLDCQTPLAGCTRSERHIVVISGTPVVIAIEPHMIYIRTNDKKWARVPRTHLMRVEYDDLVARWFVSLLDGMEVLDQHVVRVESRLEARARLLQARDGVWLADQYPR